MYAFYYLLSFGNRKAFVNLSKLLHFSCFVGTLDVIIFDCSLCYKKLNLVFKVAVAYIVSYIQCITNVTAARSAERGWDWSCAVTSPDIQL